MNRKKIRLTDRFQGHKTHRKEPICADYRELFFLASRDFFFSLSLKDDGENRSLSRSGGTHPSVKDANSREG